MERTSARVALGRSECGVVGVVLEINKPRRQRRVLVFVRDGRSRKNANPIFRIRDLGAARDERLLETEEIKDVADRWSARVFAAARVSLGVARYEIILEAKEIKDVKNADAG